MADLVQLPFEQSHPLAVAPQLRRLQNRGSVHRIRTRVGDPAWLVTGYEHVRTLLADDRLGRSHPHPESASRAGDSALFGGPLGDYDTEEADHARMRSLMQPHFSPKRMRQLRPRVQALCSDLLDELAGSDPPADLNQALALPLPILVICELLGVPYEDRTRFRQWTQAAADVTDRARSEQGLADLFTYGQQLVARKREHPEDDIVSRLSTTDGVSDDEAAMLAMGLLFAGHETTVVQIGLGALLLLTNPQQHQALRDDPGLVDSAVEEILRAPSRSGGGGGIVRYARTDFDVGGVTIRAGDLVMLDIAAANHDAGVFTDPDLFDVARRAAAAHMTFGHGARYCIGAPLARIELHAVFSQLPQRFPTLRLAVPVEELRVRSDQLTSGLVDLPVTW